MGDLDGIHVLVTGAGSGIGHALAAGFKADGAIVSGCDLPKNLDACREVCHQAVGCDVTDRQAVEAMVAALTSAHGVIGVLVANAGTGVSRTIEDAEWSDIESVIAVNLFGVMHCVRAVLPGMREAGTGRIMVLASRNAELCPAGLVGYNVSKAGVAAFTRTLSRELRGTDILVNNLIPGPTATPLNPRGTREPSTVYPTAKMLATLPAGGPSGKTFFDLEEYPLFKLFIDASKGGG